jgi:hypothetical protein
MVKRKDSINRTPKGGLRPRPGETSHESALRAAIKDLIRLHPSFRKITTNGRRGDS